MCVSVIQYPGTISYCYGRMLTFHTSTVSRQLTSDIYHIWMNLKKDMNRLTDSDIVIIHGKDNPSQQDSSENTNSDDDNLESGEEKVKPHEAMEAIDNLMSFLNKQIVI
jgi:hypothetical protein